MTPSPAVPDRVLEFEAPEVHALVWLPLAVRYKLDVIGCRLRLAQWQAIAPAARAPLLACAAGEPFRRLLLDLGLGPEDADVALTGDHRLVQGDHRTQTRTVDELNSREIDHDILCAAFERLQHQILELA